MPPADPCLSAAHTSDREVIPLGKRHLSSIRGVSRPSRGDVVREIFATKCPRPPPLSHAIGASRPQCGGLIVTGQRYTARRKRTQVGRLRSGGSSTQSPFPRICCWRTIYCQNLAQISQPPCPLLDKSQVLLDAIESNADWVDGNLPVLAAYPGLESALRLLVTDIPVPDSTAGTCCSDGLTMSEAVPITWEEVSAKKAAVQKPCWSKEGRGGLGPPLTEPGNTLLYCFSVQ